MADAQEQQEVQQEEKPKSKLPYILIGFVVLLGIIVFIAFTMISGGGESNAIPAEKPDVIGYQYKFPSPFVNNLAPPDDQYMATAEVTLEVFPRTGFSEREALEEIGVDGSDNNKNRMAQIKQTINEVFATKTRTELTNQPGRERVRNQIKLRLNAILRKARVEAVYLEEFIIN